MTLHDTAAEHPTFVKLQEVFAPSEPRAAYPEPQLGPTEIVALIRGKTFLATDRTGDVMPPGHPNVGFFSNDTRYLSQLQLLVNGHAAVVLSSTTSDAYATRVEMTAKGSILADGLDLPVNTVYMRREQVLEDNVLHDVLHMQNFHSENIRLTIEVNYDADFMDIFQVRGILRGMHGTYYAPVHTATGSVFVYDGLDGKTRSTTVSFDPPPAKVQNKTASWAIELRPLEKARISGTVVPEMRNTDPRLRSEGMAAVAVDVVERDVEGTLHDLRHDLDEWKAECSRFRSDNDIFDAMLQTCVEDFYALQIKQPAGRAIAAGIPWFATLFGRDSLIASFQTLILNRQLAQGTLRVLAAHQGTRHSDERDEDPGKILHELRTGEMTSTGEVAFGMNYGSVDATPLFIILLSEYFRWSGDVDFLDEMRPHLIAAVQWMEKYADFDGDGLLEYCRRSPKGLFNQGWKDSGDANAHADGRIAEPPVALVEVQGYAVDAYARADALFATLGEDAQAGHLVARSQDLRAKLDTAFWMPEEKYFAMALDRDKQPLRVRGSNPGHLLFANAIDITRARPVVETLMGRGLNCGWGIRTLSDEEVTFNPMSYHRGSVWPHDNAMTAYGMAVYGFHAESSRLCTSLYEAALRFRDYRLPELFCGIQRGRGDDPVHYPVSCSPQAWASGAMFLMLTGLLGIRVNASAREVQIVNPHLPAFLNELAIDGMRVGKSAVWLEFVRREGRTFCNVTRLEGEEISISVVYR